MASRKADAPDLTPGQATYILERLLRERRISAAELSRYRRDIDREIEELERRLQTLRGSAAAASGAGGERGAAAGARRRAGRAAEQRPEARGTNPHLASMQIQGRYLSLIRRIPVSRRTHFQKIAKERGREAAINEMQATLGGGQTERTRGRARKAPQGVPRRKGEGRTKRRRRAADPKVAASQQLQGRYLGLIRQIPENRRAQYQKIAREKGREAAIREMQDALRK